MITPYSKDCISDHFRRYLQSVRFVKSLNDGKDLPVKVCNISGLAGEHLMYHLVDDGVVPIFDVGKIQHVEMRGDKKTGENEDGEVGGDLVIFCENLTDAIIGEVKTFTHDSGFTNKSVNNEKADFWLLCDCRPYRHGLGFVTVSIIKNFEKYSTTFHMEGNHEDKLKLKNIIKIAKEAGIDYFQCKDIDLESYFSKKDTDDKSVVHSNGYWSWA